MQKIWDEPYKDGLAELVTYYKDVPGIESKILTMQSVRSVIEAFYQVLVNHKELEEISTLSETERRRIWKLTEGCEERLKAARAIYLMEKILEK